MVKLSHAFGRFSPFKVLVLGDFMLDAYTHGKVKRVSPEAPVPVMEVVKQEVRAGGAGNVVLNLVSLGGSVTAAGRIGDDEEGKQLKQVLSSEGVYLDHLLVEKGYRTPIKTRLIADSQQLLRVDLEKIAPLEKSLEEEMIGKLEDLIPKVEIVAISDYGKGFLTAPLLEAALSIAKAAKIPTIVDPKGIDFTKYRGATVLKPNLSEAYAAAKIPFTRPLEEVADTIFRQVAVDLLLVTRSEAGMTLFTPGKESVDFPVRSKEVKDVTGAGDTVLAVICLALASGFDMNTAAEIANIAAGLSIERLGCAQITLPEIAKRLLEIDSDTKIFDESHTFALQKILHGKKYSLLVLEKGQEISSSLFKTIREISKKEGELIIYVKDFDPDDDFVHLLSSLQEVNYIILQTESVKNLCAAISPHEIYHMKKDLLLGEKEAKNLIYSLLEV